MAGLRSAGADSGPRKLDGFNLWPSLLSGGASPREEVIHQLSNNYSAAPGLAISPDAIRVGEPPRRPPPLACLCV